ncbi:MAG: hypothetical protein ACE5GL_04255 [Calditrichia bacterium]
MKRIYYGLITVLLFAVMAIPVKIYSQMTEPGWISGENVLYTDPSNTKVGIGTQNPLAPLEVNAVGLKLFLNQGNNSSPSYMKFKVKTNQPSWTMGLSIDNNFMIGISEGLTDTKFFIDGTGNIGIGTERPESKLSISGDIDISGSRLHVGTDGKVGIGLPGPVGRFHIRGALAGEELLRLEESTATNLLKVIIDNQTGRVDFQTQNNEIPGAFPDIVLNPSGGNVGVGTTNPSYKFHVKGILNADTLYRNGSLAGIWDIAGNDMYYNGGNIGIGTAMPSEPLHIYQSGDSGATTLRLEYKYTGTPNGEQDADWRLQAASSGGKFHISSGTLPRLTIDGAGNVGIGTSNPDPAYKLSVPGKIRAEEIVVETGWSDFVFEDDYQIPPLKEVEKFIEENGHLPDIPSAEEVAASGVSVGEMQAKLLQKIEELTLYVMELKKENEGLKGQMVYLKNRFEKADNIGQ